MKSIIVGMVAAAGLMVAGSAMAFSGAACGACHKAAADAAGPSFASIKAAYGSKDELAKVFKGGFKVEDRKVAAGNDKWKKSAGLMTGQFGSLIKGHEDDAAAFVFSQ